MYASGFSMITVFLLLRDVFCCLTQERDWWSLLLVQPYGSEFLAMFDTCSRMSSIEVVRLGSSGPGRPSTSHLIFGFRVARARFFLVLSARHPVDSFISAPLYMEPTSPTLGESSMY